MKKLLLTLTLSIHATTMFGQSYRSSYSTMRIPSIEYNTYESHSGIKVNSITSQADGSYLVVLYNSNYDDDSNTRTSNHFYWYLSYKGKRVSDSYDSTIRCRTSLQKVVRTWSGKVPKGNERYVTVQLGRDRRDDD